MLPHQQRVVDEKTELDIKLEALRTFIFGNKIYKDLSTCEQGLLLDQMYAMTNYSDVLHERIECFTETV